MCLLGMDSIFFLGNRKQNTYYCFFLLIKLVLITIDLGLLSYILIGKLVYMCRLKSSYIVKVEQVKDAALRLCAII